MFLGLLISNLQRTGMSIFPVCDWKHLYVQIINETLHFMCKLLLKSGLWFEYCLQCFLFKI